MKVKRVLILFFSVILFFILQNTLVNYIELGSVSPNICLVLIVSIAYFNGSSYGTVFGFMMGLLTDIFFGNFFGFYSLIYVLIGYLCGLFNKSFFDYNFDLKLPTGLIIVSSLFYNLIVYVCFFLLKGELDFKFYLWKRIVPGVLYTFIIGALIYRILYSIDQKISLDERKADGYFVS